jgi:SAM-dependent methyltransferase
MNHPECQCDGPSDRPIPLSVVQNSRFAHASTGEPLRFMRRGAQTVAPDRRWSLTPTQTTQPVANDMTQQIARGAARINEDRQVRRCPVCAGDTAHDVVFHKLSYPILRCRECGLGATAIPAGFDPDSLYQRSYFQGEVTDGYGDYLASEPVLRKEFRRILDHIRQFREPGGKLLELGCAFGFFLAEAEAEYDCVGVDVSPAALAFCSERGLKASHPSDSAWQTAGPYDVVVMLDCIEHLKDPEAVLESVRRVTKPDALLLLTTGDWDSLYARVARTHWRLMTPPQHLYHVIDASHPWKVVPIGLMAYQLASRLGFGAPRLRHLNEVGLPVNLFDAIRVVATRSP